MTEVERLQKVKSFQEYWANKGYEKGESQAFWLSLLRDVLGVEQPERVIRFEDCAHLDDIHGFIDGYIDETSTLIEQKSANKSLVDAYAQSDGIKLTPYMQALRYSLTLPWSKRPRWIVTSNFQSFMIYDMEHPGSDPTVIRMDQLDRRYHELAFLVDEKAVTVAKMSELSTKAGKLVGVLYNSLLKCYINPDNPESLKSLNKLCVRLIFCLYAEASGIFESHQFYNYLKDRKPEDVRKALIDVFRVLNTPTDKRDPYDNSDTAKFPYVNGGLFADENIEIPNFTASMLDVFLNQIELAFDWSTINPTIFGAVFESTLNPVTRRQGGMHYTSIENIHKVIDPLFLEDLQMEFAKILEVQVKSERIIKLKEFKHKLGTITVLDPACGSGNFLTETYISLRHLENNVIKEIWACDFDSRVQRNSDIAQLGITEFLKVNNVLEVTIQNFYGIEINDFAVSVANTAMWIAEAQLIQETAGVLEHDINFLPLETYTNIHEADALEVKWEDIVPIDKLNYIIGNPPFVGSKYASGYQKAQIRSLFIGNKEAGRLDYVSCWFKKAANLVALAPHGIRATFVSTNSITQGEQVAPLWKGIFAQGIHIDFAYRSFKWHNETEDDAAVSVVIVSISKSVCLEKRLYVQQDTYQVVDNINAYLRNAPDVFIERCRESLCGMPLMRKGFEACDNGTYIFTKEEMQSFIAKEPKSAFYFKLLLGGDAILHNKAPRYFLLLRDIPWSTLVTMPECLKLKNIVADYRSCSSKLATVKLAETPMEFSQWVNITSPFLALSIVNSAKYEYIPMRFIERYDKVLVTANALLCMNAELWLFALLSSRPHNLWVRAFAGRMGNEGLNYGTHSIYNTYPFPVLTEDAKECLNDMAQAILEARNKYPDMDLATLYTHDKMPPELRKAHQLNDKYVLSLYTDQSELTDDELLGQLITRYQSLMTPKPTLLSLLPDRL